MKPYDFLVLGGGSAGFNAARVAVSLGLRTAVLDATIVLKTIHIMLFGKGR